jgi:hypothetical protein
MQAIFNQQFIYCWILDCSQFFPFLSGISVSIIYMIEDWFTFYVLIFIFDVFAFRQWPHCINGVGLELWVEGNSRAGISPLFRSCIFRDLSHCQSHLSNCLVRVLIHTRHGDRKVWGFGVRMNRVNALRKLIYIGCWDDKSVSWDVTQGCVLAAWG